MEKIATEELVTTIVGSSNLDELMEKSFFSHITLSAFLNELLEQKGMTRVDVIHRAKLNETFGYQIFVGQRRASRNKILQIAFAMELDYLETQRLLVIAEVGGLYPRDRRDAIIIFCIINHATLQETDDKLYHYGEKTIVLGE